MAKRRPPTVHGVAVVDKPAGVTSHDVVGTASSPVRGAPHRPRRHARSRRDRGARRRCRDGHPPAPLRHRRSQALHRARSSSASRPTRSTPTASSRVTHERSRVDLDAARSVIAEQLLGDIEQVPPMVSAIQVGGRRLHDLARQVSRSSGRRDRSASTASTSSGSRSEPTVGRCSQVEVDCCGRHVHPLAGRRPRSPARHRRPPPQPAPHRRRAVHDRRGGAARRVRAAATDRGRAGPREGRRRRGDRSAASPSGRPLPAPPATDRGRWSPPTGTLLAVYEPFGDGLAKPASCWPSGDRLDASP